MKLMTKFPKKSDFGIIFKGRVFSKRKVVLVKKFFLLKMAHYLFANSQRETDKPIRYFYVCDSEITKFEKDVFLQAALHLRKF